MWEGRAPRCPPTGSKTPLPPASSDWTGDGAFWSWCLHSSSFVGGVRVPIAVPGLRLACCGLITEAELQAELQTEAALQVETEAEPQAGTKTWNESIGFKTWAGSQYDRSDQVQTSAFALWTRRHAGSRRRRA